ncbi:hypothetical protein [Marinobacterium litorale]|uniref:hypothetical protein n=1 Tax=Marinobacterium litorale TaxID=404770 RepID=UPI0004253409|nr:hypothetical protein [Marinobacterium litorale]
MSKKLKVDPVLVGLIQILDKISDKTAADDFGFPITLFVDGTVLSGKAVSGATYFKKFADSYEQFFAGFGDKEAAKSFGDSYRIAGERHHPSHLGYRESDDPGYIHLIDVSIVLGDGQLMAGSGMDIRLKLEEVDGFMVGRMQRN